jgi:predicted O-linked N-acetylglucosamine transferase (SPINDLY family)
VKLGLPEESVVLAAFQDPRALDAESVQLWLRILRRSENSLLWLGDPGRAQQRVLRGRAEQSGVAPQRLLFAPQLPWRAHLARLAQADLALDTLVFGAQSGVADALGQGVPFLTVAGGTLQTRIAASLVTSCGLPELAQQTAEAMEELAVALIGDPPRLAALKAKVLAALPGSRLFDAQGFAADLEQLYLGLAVPR